MRQSFLRASLLLVGVGLGWSTTGFGADGNEILEARCAVCHPRIDNGGIHRVSEQRKTPEGWVMTLFRMTHLHGAQLTDDEQVILAKYLADTQGLTPEEAAPWRYVLERRPGVVETPEDEHISVMCARCHSYARTALQRRSEDEWLRHVHFHLGQWPTIEYQALGRDRNWWEIASTETKDLLTRHYPLNMELWDAWAAKDPPDLSGSWRVAGRQPGIGDYSGRLRVELRDDDRYRLSMGLEYADGTRVVGTGEAVLYSGHEWRASMDIGGRAVHQVFSVAEGGGRLSGRWFDATTDVIGGDLVAVREDRNPVVLDAVPGQLRAGETALITVVGAGLRGAPAFGAGVEVLRTVASSPDAISVEVQATADAAPGSRPVAVGSARSEADLVVYERIDSVRVEPPEAIARVGNNGGPIPKVPAQFDAIAYANGPDGETGTADDLRIGPVAAEWSVENANELAASLSDAEFTGSIEDSGLFVPAGAGLNPARPFSTNNAGDLLVKARVSDGKRQVEASGHLVVTVQRWNDPPIR